MSHPEVTLLQAPRRLVGLAVLGLWALGAQAQAPKAASSVVKVRCTLNNGNEDISTGFVWGDRLHVVTTLHGVVGCKTLRVWSEQTHDDTTARVERVVLEGDLALLKLDKDLKLEPLGHLAELPRDMDGKFSVWGYPNGIPTMDGLPLQFGNGLKGRIVTLKEFVSGIKGYDDLFAGASFPTPGTSVLRVATVLQPGHSGAPILDADGRVVAICDGGLLGGWRALNWSIPAFRYLPRLPQSTDPVPGASSQRPDLFAAVAVAPPKTVAMPSKSSGSGEQVRTLRRVRTLALGELERQLRLHRSDEGDVALEFIRMIRARAPSAAAVQRLGFDIYEDPYGATLGVPAGIEIAWNKEAEVLEASSKSNTVHMRIGVYGYDDFADAKAHAIQDFLETFEVDDVKWKGKPPARLRLAVEPDEEYASAEDFFEGRYEGQPVNLSIAVTVSGSEALGSGVVSLVALDQLDTNDAVMYLMMQVAVRSLSDFAAN